MGDSSLGEGRDGDGEARASGDTNSPRTPMSMALKRGQGKSRARQAARGGQLRALQRAAPKRGSSTGLRTSASQKGKGKGAGVALGA